MSVCLEYGDEQPMSSILVVAVTGGGVVISHDRVPCGHVMVGARQVPQPQSLDHAGGAERHDHRGQVRMGVGTIRQLLNMGNAPNLIDRE
jgi:hypothetical protein